MQRRLGNVLWWASLVIAGGWLCLMYVVGINFSDPGWWLLLVPAGVIVLIGLAARYVLAGGSGKA
jgi:hypothetical protein